MPADVPITGLPAAGSVTGPDLFAVVQGGVTKQGTISMILDALSGTSAVSAVALADLIPVAQGGVTKKATGQQLFNALGALAAQGGIADGDLIPIVQAAIAKRMTFIELFTQILGGIPSATTSVRGFMSAADKTVLNAANSAGTANTLAKYSGTGGLNPARLIIGAASGAGTVIDSILFKPYNLTFTGGAATENFNADIAPAGFTVVPTWGIIVPVDPHYNATWLVTDVGNTATVAKCQLHRIDETPIAAGNKRLMGLFVQLSNTPP